MLPVSSRFLNRCQSNANICILTSFLVKICNKDANVYGTCKQVHINQSVECIIKPRKRPPFQSTFHAVLYGKFEIDKSQYIIPTSFQNIWTILIPTLIPFMVQNIYLSCLHYKFAEITYPTVCLLHISEINCYDEPVTGGPAADEPDKLYQPR